MTQTQATVGPITGGRSVSTTRKEVADGLSSIGSDCSSSESELSARTRAEAAMTDPIRSRNIEPQSPFKVIDLTKDSIKKHKDVFSLDKGTEGKPMPPQTPSFDK